MTKRSPGRAWLVSRVRALMRRLMRPDIQELRGEIQRAAASQSDPNAEVREDPTIALGRLIEALGNIQRREHDLVVRFDTIGPHLEAIERKIARLEERMQAMQALQSIVDERTDRLAGARWDHEAVHRRLAAIEDRLAEREAAGPD